MNVNQLEDPTEDRHRHRQCY